MLRGCMHTSGYSTYSCWFGFFCECNCVCKAGGVWWLGAVCLRSMRARRCTWTLLYPDRWVGRRFRLCQRAWSGDRNQSTNFGRNYVSIILCHKRKRWLLGRRCGGMHTQGQWQQGHIDTCTYLDVGWPDNPRRRCQDANFNNTHDNERLHKMLFQLFGARPQWW